MGKSPGKWIKKLLFRKKSSSHVSKKAANHNASVEGKGSPAFTVGSPVISHPLPVNITNPESEKRLSPNSTVDGVILSASQHLVKEGHAECGTSNVSKKSKEEQVAVKLQAAIRGYLARRAYHALWGIIRLQALVRGHMVRRQAVATLRCVQGIVKVQALVRGRKARLSPVGNEVHAKFCNTQLVDGKNFVMSGAIVSSQMMLSYPTFVCKLLSSRLVLLPLQMQYIHGDSNSAWDWLKRWTFSHFWKPRPQPKRTVDLKSQVTSSAIMQTESGKPKHVARRKFPATSDSGSTNSTPQSEKTKRNLNKINSSPASQERPQSELEKVKYNLRKITNSISETTKQVEAEKTKRSIRRASKSQSDIPEQGVMHSAENDVIAVAQDVETSAKPDLDTKPNLDAALKPVEEGAGVNSLNEDNLNAEPHPLQGTAQDENHPPLNSHLEVKEEKVCNGNHNSSKRASFPAKPEYVENGLPNSPTLPSYMAATESAKAKLRAQGSPRISSDGVDKSGFTRRHSLPSTINGKLVSLSPRIQRLVQTSCKNGIKSDRALSSSRDGNEKSIQVEWRR